MLLKKTIATLSLSLAVAGSAFAQSFCPSVQAIHSAIYEASFAPNFFAYSLQNNLVIVSIPPTNQNPTPTKAQADKVLASVTAVYPLEQSGPCFYAPYAKLPAANNVFVMWSDQLPPNLR